jgi:integrase
MTAMALQDAAGRRRSPPTLPGYHAGCPPRNKGLRYSADPPSVEEIIAVMRQAGTTTQGLRARALIVVLWRAGLRIGEALALGERDLDERRGSVLHLDELRLRSNELGTVASDEALRVNNQTLSRVPGDPVASNRLGIALLALGRHAEAEEVLVSAVKAHPDNRIAARRLVEARAKLSRTQAPPRSVRRASARHVAQQVHVVT